MTIAASLPNHPRLHGGKHTRPRREKVYGPAQGIPLDRNAKARIMTYARAYTAKHRRKGQHWGPLTRAYIQVLEALLWGFHNSKDGRCMPSYESIAVKARCNRDTVYEAIKALEAADVLTWVQRIVKVAEQQRDLFGQWVNRWRIIRTSNAYLFRDPLPCAAGRPVSGFSSKSENPTGTLNPDFFLSYEAPRPAPPPLSPELNAVLVRLGSALADRQDKERAMSAA